MNHYQIYNKKNNRPATGKEIEYLIDNNFLTVDYGQDSDEGIIALSLMDMFGAELEDYEVKAVEYQTSENWCKIAYDHKL